MLSEVVYSWAAIVFFLLGYLMATLQWSQETAEDDA